MTLLHQAAQKAVEALKKVDGALESRGEYVQEISAALVNLQAALREAALQQQEVPREPVADTHIDALLNALDDVAREYDSYEYGLPMHNSGEADDPLHKLRAAVREWLAASPSTTQQQEAGNGWRPIESAPKDGTEILVWRDDAGAFMAMWTCVNDLRTTSDKDRDELDEDTLFSYDWFGGDAEGNFRCDGSEAPTLWQPMPAAPSTPESAEKDDAGGGKGSVSPSAGEPSR